MTFFNNKTEKEGTAQEDALVLRRFRYICDALWQIHTTWMYPDETTQYSQRKFCLLQIAMINDQMSEGIVLILGTCVLFSPPSDLAVMGETPRSTNHKASSKIRKLIYQPIAIFATICRNSEAVLKGVALVFIIM